MKAIVACFLAITGLQADPGILVEIDVFAEQIAKDNLGIEVDGEQIG